MVCVIDTLIVFGSALAGSAVVMLLCRWSARRRTDRQARRNLAAGGRLLPTGEFTGVHAEGTNALHIIERELSSR